MRTSLPLKPDSTSGSGSDRTLLPGREAIGLYFRLSREILQNYAGRIIGGCRVGSGRARDGTAENPDPTSGSSVVRGMSSRFGRRPLPPRYRIARLGLYFRQIALLRARCGGIGMRFRGRWIGLRFRWAPAPDQGGSRFLSRRSRAGGDRRPAGPMDRGSGPSRRPQHGLRDRPPGPAPGSL